ncbi:hypothetical protein [Brevundimonas goettingensis]|uniref:Uncharacterized protein n=1 Tax=Brevundimonas goettingensis TaxID=2774190 RepID=A0A975C5N5_9CAUL|nr:hypothetical protein [Brevundimonas goettingensis]QTC92032.1 hypothetical protein IFJ75_03700 [Brevundimonas goettingensis]
MSPIYLFTLVVFAVVGLAALLRGERWERTAVAVLAAAWIGSALTPFNKVDPPWMAIGLDVAVFLFLLYAALYSRRGWTSAAAGFQFLILCTHFVFARDRTLEQWAYISAYYVWNLGVFAALACGVVWRGGKAARP